MMNDVKRPPIIGAAILFITSAPVPVDHMIGKSPRDAQATVINRIVYASLEAPRIESDDQISFDILWCPHQDHYRAFDCRVQRYFVQGMIDALKEFFGMTGGLQVRFDSTIPAGAKTCHFTMWRSSESGEEWDQVTKLLEEKALEIAKQTK